MMKSVIWWRKPEYPEETTDIRQVTDETFHTYGLCPVRGLTATRVCYTPALSRTPTKDHYGPLGSCTGTSDMLWVTITLTGPLPFCNEVYFSSLGRSSYFVPLQIILLQMSVTFRLSSLGWQGSSFSSPSFSSSSSFFFLLFLPLLRLLPRFVPLIFTFLGWVWSRHGGVKDWAPAHAHLSSLPGTRLSSRQITEILLACRPWSLPPSDISVLC